ncbi:DnaJ-domain-containing protein [Rickenella mellea]|uniref:DnaJ-domain-containing protein n=1 Tax=Rickenella mellea TaxID=50990 RepID=A0A4Y7QB33_9AGAM|nr:DnaJ-domain-containing protein [Rickenella mellea]
MASRLYEALDVVQDASQEEIRKAYRKKALQTHPDRLPPGATPDEKKKAEDNFRIVNNAYEVLSDESKRKVYDVHGVWPPPEPEEHFSSRPRRPGHTNTGHHRHTDQPRHTGWTFGHDPFNGPSFHDNNNPFDHPFSIPRRTGAGGVRPSPAASFGFTDPFALFNSIFGDMQRQFASDPFFADAFGPPHPMMPPMDPFFRRHGLGIGLGFNDLHDRPHRDHDRHHVHHHHQALPSLRTSSFPVIPTMDPNFPLDTRRSHSANYDERDRGPRGGIRWVSESRVTRVTNGVKQSVWKRRDSDGNEHITYTYPDGRERYLVNGVEQQQRQDRLPSPPSPPPPSDPVIPPPPPYSAAPPYSAVPPLRPRDRDRDRHHHRDHHHHLQQQQPQQQHISQQYQHSINAERERERDPHAKKRWWRGDR